MRAGAAKLPTYGFKNNETGEEFEDFMSIAARDKFLQDNPHITQLPCAPAILGRGVEMGNRMKPSEGFREVLKGIARNNPGSNINTF